MTQKEINEFLADTKVYVNGKSTEIQEKLLSFGFLWMGHNGVLHTEKTFLYLNKIKEIKHGDDMKYFTEHEYREITAEQILSLELTEPTYRPFKNADECWNEMLKHQPFGWLNSKNSDSFSCIGGICQYGKKVNITWTTNEKEWFESSFIYDNYTFADGTPFGIKEE